MLPRRDPRSGHARAYVSGGRFRRLLPADPQSSGGNLTSGPRITRRRELPRASGPLRNLPLAKGLRQEETGTTTTSRSSPGCGRLQSRELEAAGISTLAQFGALPLPLPFTPRRGSEETYIRLREQARVQLEGRIKGEPVHELLLPIEADQGLARLPAPSAGDVFLDLEGARFARDGGREYLFGLVILEADGSLTNRSYWAHSDAEERAAFETVVDEILALWEANPGMHIYHYAPYEPSAFKRLMGRYATREAEVDRMLRAGLFVDLHAVVRRALRASVERYSIKDLEQFYGFSRAVELADANINLRVVERALEASAVDAITPDVRSCSRRL